MITSDGETIRVAVSGNLPENRRLITSLIMQKLGAYKCLCGYLPYGQRHQKDQWPACREKVCPVETKAPMDFKADAQVIVCGEPEGDPAVSHRRSGGADLAF